jgi:hypothetical protein
MQLEIDVTVGVSPESILAFARYFFFFNVLLAAWPPLVTME